MGMSMERVDFNLCSPVDRTTKNFPLVEKSFGLRSFIVRANDHSAQLLHLMGAHRLPVDNSMVSTEQGNSRIIARENAATAYMKSIGAI